MDTQKGRVAVGGEGELQTMAQADGTLSASMEAADLSESSYRDTQKNISDIRALDLATASIEELKARIKALLFRGYTCQGDRFDAGVKLFRATKREAKTV